MNHGHGSTTLATAPQPIAASTTTLAARARIQLGITPPRGRDVLQRTAEIESATGIRFATVQTYYKFGDNFPTGTEAALLAQGKTPLISWNGTDTQAVNSGSQDSLITARADAIKALGKPVYLRWFWEPDVRKKQALTRSPADYIAAWRHVRTLFRREGTTNAQWVWCPTSEAFDSGTAATYYPGDDQVDWLCADGYDRAPGPELIGGPTAKQRSFSQIFAAFYAFAEQHPKPVLIAEFGVQSTAPGGQAAWLVDAAAAVSRYPKIKVLVYWDDADQQTGYDYRLDQGQGLNGLVALAAA